VVALQRPVPLRARMWKYDGPCGAPVYDFVVPVPSDTLSGMVVATWSKTYE
jgi:hypothetical protein